MRCIITKDKTTVKRKRERLGSWGGKDLEGVLGITTTEAGRLADKRDEFCTAVKCSPG